MLRFIFALCILHTNCLLDVLFTNISFHFVCCLLALVVSFTLRKLFILMKSQQHFCFCFLTSVAYLERKISGQCQRRCCLSFLLCMVSGLTFRSFIHFEFIFYIYGVRKWSSLIFLHVAAWFSQHHLFLSWGQVQGFLKRLSLFLWIFLPALLSINGSQSYRFVSCFGFPFYSIDLSVSCWEILDC